MSERHRQQWEALAADDPFWAVLTVPGMRGGKWDRAAFYQTGDDEISELLQVTARLGIEIRYGSAIDYGCGVGRLSQALSRSFDEVIAIDISENMLTLARAEHGTLSNIRFLRGSGDNLSAIAGTSVDFVYSNIVLQHVPQPTQRALVREFCRVLRPGGVLAFQTPSQPRLRSLTGFVHLMAGNRLLNLARRLKYGKARIMEMHTFRRNEVIQLLGKAGMEVIAVQEDDCAGAAFTSYRYFSIKR